MEPDNEVIATRNFLNDDASAPKHNSVALSTKTHAQARQSSARRDNFMDSPFPKWASIYISRDCTQALLKHKSLQVIAPQSSRNSVQGSTVRETSRRLPRPALVEPAKMTTNRRRRM
jgi:hypothetical protein